MQSSRVYDVPVLEAFGRFLNVLGEVGHLEKLADFDDVVVSYRRSLEPFDRLFA
jgi:hypothetical protein